MVKAGDDEGGKALGAVACQEEGVLGFLAEGSMSG